MSEAIKIHLSLSSQSDVVLDLCEGFSGKPQLTLHNEGADEITHCHPFHAELERNNDRDGREDEILNLGRGLRYGALTITDGVGRKLSINYAGERDKGSYYELVSTLPGLTEFTDGFGRISPKLLDLLGRHLIPGRAYRLGFSGEPMEILCEVGEEDPETHEREWAKIEPSWDPYAIPFTVVAGTQKPRFTMSVIAPSSICHTPGTPKFHLIMHVTSLERRPVTVNLQLDNFVEMWPQSPAYRWEKWGSYDMLRITCESDGRECLLNAKHPPEQALLPEGSFDPSKGLVEFTHGTTYTYHFHLGNEDLLHDRGKAPYVHDNTYILRMKPQGFAAWDYGSEKELLRTHQKPSDWCKHGAIVFEPVCDVAVTVKAILEREAPMPLFRLPPELREEVYGYLRFAEYADRIRFTADLGW